MKVVFAIKVRNQKSEEIANVRKSLGKLEKIFFKISGKSGNPHAKDPLSLLK
jgi:hypothetical protein